MGAFKNLFKRKEGGTPLGNTIRGILKSTTNGLLGNGLLMKKAGETKAQENDRIIQSVSAGVGATSQQNAAMGGAYVGNPTPAEISAEKGAKKGAIGTWITNNWKKVAAIGGGVVAFFVIVFSVLKSKKKIRRR